MRRLPAVWYGLYPGPDDASGQDAIPGLRPEGASLHASSPPLKLSSVSTFLMDRTTPYALHFVLLTTLAGSLDRPLFYDCRST